MPSFIELNDQIDLNEKRLAFEYDRYERYYSRFTLVSILYSILAIYLVQLIKFCYSQDNSFKTIYICAFICFLGFIIYSVYHALRLLMPKDVSFQQTPREFYKNIRKQYVETGITDELVLNEYIRASYNSQLEEAVEANFRLNIEKSMHYFRAFRTALLSIIPYLICISMYLYGGKGETNSILIKNYKDIVLFNDSVEKGSLTNNKLLPSNSIETAP